MIPDVPWDTGRHYWYAWLLWDLILITGVLLNAVVIGLTTFNKTISASFVSPSVRYLAMEDMGFSLFCFLQCLSNLTQGEYLGQWASCRFQAIYLTFFILCTGYSLVYYAYVCKNRIVNFGSKTDWEGECLKFHLVSWTWCLFLGILCSFITEPQLLQSGLACLVDLRKWWNFCIFTGFGVVSIVIMLAIQYRQIIASVRSTQEACGRATSGGSRDNMRALFIRITLFVSVFIVAAFPIFVLSVINLIKGTPAPPDLDLVVGIFTHLQSTVNPILYFALHPHHRNETIRIMQRYLGITVLTSSSGVSNGAVSSEVDKDGTKSFKTDLNSAFSMPTSSAISRGPSRGPTPTPITRAATLDSFGDAAAKSNGNGVALGSPVPSNGSVPQILIDDCSDGDSHAVAGETSA